MIRPVRMITKAMGYWDIVVKESGQCDNRTLTVALIV